MFRFDFVTLLFGTAIWLPSHPTWARMSECREADCPIGGQTILIWCKDSTDI